jgi:hypothetical protein
MLNGECGLLRIKMNYFFLILRLCRNISLSVVASALVERDYGDLGICYLLYVGTVWANFIPRARLYKM